MTITIKTEEIYNDFNYFLCFLCVRRVPRGIGVGQLELQMEFCVGSDVEKKLGYVQQIREARFWASILLFTELARLAHQNPDRIFSGMSPKAWLYRSLTFSPPS